MNRTESIKLIAGDAGNWLGKRFERETTQPVGPATSPDDLRLTAIAGSSAC